MSIIYTKIPINSRFNKSRCNNLQSGFKPIKIYYRAEIIRNIPSEYNIQNSNKKSKRQKPKKRKKLRKTRKTKKEKTLGDFFKGVFK